ncbi:MAG: hypothetical protein WCJ29_00055 [bacterium]
MKNIFSEKVLRYPFITLALVTFSCAYFMFTEKSREYPHYSEAVLFWFALLLPVVATITLSSGSLLMLNRDRRALLRSFYVSWSFVLFILIATIIQGISYHAGADEWLFGIFITTAYSVMTAFISSCILIYIRYRVLKQSGYLFD